MWPYATHLITVPVYQELLKYVNSFQKTDSLYTHGGGEGPEGHGEQALSFMGSFIGNIHRIQRDILLCGTLLIWRTARAQPDSTLLSPS